MKIKHLLINTALVSCSFLVCLLILEFLLRIKIIDIDHFMMSRTMLWGFMNEKKNHEGATSIYAFSDTVGYENINIYSKILGAKDEKDKFKILVVGDSVSEWDGYVNYLDKELSKLYSDNILIINSGIGGYNTKMEYDYLSKKGIGSDPDFVIIQLHSNDLTSTPVIVPKGDRWIAFETNNVTTQINPKLYKSSYLYRFLLAVKLMRVNDAGVDGDENNTNQVKVSLEKIITLLDSNNVSYMLVLFPIFEKSYYADSLHRTMVKIVNDLGLKEKFIDLYPIYSLYDFEKISLDHDHPNELGSRIAADEIKKLLLPSIDEKIISTFNFTN